MRFVATMLLWLVTTVLLAAAVPAAWAQQHLVDEGGFGSEEHTSELQSQR